jgi:predicted transcriptional regulator
MAILSVFFDSSGGGALRASYLSLVIRRGESIRQQIGYWVGATRMALSGQMLYEGRMSTKEVLLEVAEKLPPDATLVDAIYELEFRQAVEEGLASLDRGERTALEEVRKHIPQWTSKFSSPPEP